MIAARVKKKDYACTNKHEKERAVRGWWCGSFLCERAHAPTVLEPVKLGLLEKPHTQLQEEDTEEG
jgi:hypothetical protein